MYAVAGRSRATPLRFDAWADLLVVELPEDEIGSLVLVDAVELLLECVELLTGSVTK